MIPEKYRRFLYGLLAIGFGGTALFILIINLLKFHFIRVLNYYLTLDTLLNNPVMMLLGVLFVVGLFLIFKTIEHYRSPLNWRKPSHRNLVLLSGLVFFIIQIYMVYNYCFETDWDVQILLDSARSLANGQRPIQNGWYYSFNSNNVLLTLIFTVILWITKPLHLGSLDFLSILAVQSLICVLTGFMLYQIMVHRWQRRDIAWLGMVLYLLLVGLSPWVSIPYSDSWGLFFPIAMLWVYDCAAIHEKRFLRWFIIASLAYIGFKIKPQVIFIFITLIAIEVVATLLRREKISVREIIRNKSLHGGIVGFAMAFVLIWGIMATRVIPYNSDNRFGAPHYLMLGLNWETMGIYSDKDVCFSRQFDTPRERDRANLQESWRRVREMGAGGLAGLLCEKTLLNYYDGTFAWGKEGSFYKKVFPEPNQHLAPFLRNIYYNRDYQGKYYLYWTTSATAIWLGILVLMFLAAIGKQDRFTAALMLSIIMLTLYESVFEARARYLYTYIPFYILLALQGLRNVEIFFSLKRKGF